MKGLSAEGLGWSQLSDPHVHTETFDITDIMDRKMINVAPELEGLRVSQICARH